MCIRDRISAAYGTSIKFTAVSNKFCHIKGWKLDGTEVTDTTEGISISADGSELTLSEVKKEHSVEAIFDAATMYEVSYEVDETSEGAAFNAGTLNAKAGNTCLLYTSNTGIFNRDRAGKDIYL